MDIQIKLEKEDWKKYQNYIERELPKQLKSGTDSFWVNLIFWMVASFIFMVIYRQFTTFHWPTAILVGAISVLIFAVFLLNMFKVRKAFEPSDTGSFCGVHRFRFTEQGIESEGNGFVTNHSWQIVKKVERTQGMILIYFDTAIAYVFPESKLSDPDGVYKYILERFTNPTQS